MLNPTFLHLTRQNYGKTLINSFVKESIKKGAIEPQEFWKVREFSSPGSFKYYRTHLDDKVIDKPFLIFESSIFYSEEFLVSDNSVIELSKIKKQCKNILFETESEFFCVKNNDDLAIIYEKSIDEMGKANGFLDIKGWDKELVKNKKWRVISNISRLNIF